MNTLNLKTIFSATVTAALSRLFIVVALIGVSAPLALAIPTSVFKAPFKQTQTLIIDLSNRNGANQFRDVNRLLNIGNYKLVIEKAKKVLVKNPNSGLANEVLGTAYFLNSQPLKAIPVLKKAIEAELYQSGSLTKLGIIYMEDNKLAEAEKLLLQAIQINPKHRFAHQRLGLLYEFQKKDTLAIQHFYQGLQGANKNYIGITVNLGRLLNRTGNFPATIAILEPRIPQHKKLSDAQLILATAYLATGEFTKARLRYQRVLQLGQTSSAALLGLAKALRGEGDLTTALIAVNKLIQLQPKSANARLEKGEILLRQNKKKQSNTAFEQAVSLGADRNFINQRIAKFHLDRKEFARAREIYHLMVKNGTADAFVFGQLSELLMASGEIQEGDQILIQGIKQYPDSGYLHLRHGSYLASIGKYKESLPILKSATELSPKNATFWKTYAFALTRAGYNKDAAKAAAKLFELQPNTIETAMFYATRLEATNQLDKAEDIYQKILKAEPQNALVLNNLANNLARKSNYKEAEKMARRATKIINNNGSILDTLGWILYRQGRLNEALDVLSHASNVAPDSAIIWYHKGKVLAKAKRQAESKMAFNKALSLTSTADWAADAKKHLQ